MPVIAERGAMTTFHPHHIAERYGLFTVIVLGESVTAATLAFQSALDEAENAGTLIGLAVAGIVTLFCLWWIYFDHEQNPRLDTARRSFVWGYGHYFVFASAAAVGAGLVVAVAFEREETHGIGYVISSLATTVPVAIYLITVCLLHAHPGRRGSCRGRSALRRPWCWPIRSSRRRCTSPPACWRSWWWC